MPGPVAPIESCCQTSCDEVASIQVPGPAGVDGTPGADGVDGISPVTSVTAQFLMPAEGVNVTVAVSDSTGIVVGSYMFVQTAGTMQVISKPNNISVVLQNVENTASGLYLSNAAPTTPIPAASLMMPTGQQGASGALSGAAGGHLTGNYPNPTIGLNTTKGRLIVGDGATVDDLAVGADGTVLHGRSAQALGVQWSGIDLGGTLTTISGAVPIANGGGAATTANANFNNWSPVTNRGDLIYRNATVNARLALGTVGKVLQSNGTDPLYDFVDSTNIDPVYKLMQRYGLIATGTVNLNGAAGTDVTILSLVTDARYTIRKVMIDSASVNLSVSAATIGLYTAAGTGGTAIVTAPNSELTNLTTANMFEDLTLAAPAAYTVFIDQFLYVYLQAAHGVAATVRIYVFGENLST